MKPFLLPFLIVFFLSATLTPVAAQQEVTHTIVNPRVVGPTLIFELWSRSTGDPAAFRVGFTGYYFIYSTHSLGSPVISDINPKYTTGSPSASYDAATAGTAGESFYINLNYNFSGPGDVLETAGPLGEKICLVTFTIKRPGETGTVSWDAQNSSSFNTESWDPTPPVYQGNIDMPLIENITLPITLTSFSADLQQSGNVEIKWGTAMEKDNKEFIVQRSQDAVAFTDMRTLPGAGNSTAARRYGISDAFPLPGTSYYRLKQVDFSGDVSYSKVVSVRSYAPLAAPLLVKSARPNPFQGQTEITYHLPAQASVLLTLSDAMGKVVVTENAEARAGANTYILKADQLPHGLYYLNLTDGHSRSSYKLVRGR